MSIKVKIITMFGRVFNVCRCNQYDNYNIEKKAKETYMDVRFPHSI